MKVFEPKQVSLRAAIVVSRFNGVLTDRLLDGAMKALENSAEVTIVRVPGSFEIPVVCARLAEHYDLLVALGVVIKGETEHDRLIVDSVSKTLSELSVCKGIPIGFGLLSLNSIQQAEKRCGDIPHHNKGFEAGIAALETAQILASIGDLTDSSEVKSSVRGQERG